MIRASLLIFHCAFKQLGNAGKTNPMPLVCMLLTHELIPPAPFSPGAEKGVPM